MKTTGILAPVFSLPGDYGIGDFSHYAYEFVDMLHEAGMKIWQVLPLNPVGSTNSPYQPYSSFAGETIYIDLISLYEEGLLSEKPAPFMKDSQKADYPAVRAYKETFFKEAFDNFRKQKEDSASQKAFREFTKAPWVRKYGEFVALLKRNDEKCWNEWEEIVSTDNGSEKISSFDDSPKFTDSEEESIALQMFLQYEFFVQWKKLKAYANKKQVKIMGDIPFYVGMNSLDVYMNQDQFLLDTKGYPTVVAGVPPDYFSATGQRWGNPIYDWDKMEKNGFGFFMERITGQAEMYDMLRIDHFRAFDTYWTIPSSCPTAIEGEWIEAPGYAFFEKLLPEIPKTKIIAEDLGLMRKDVYKLRDHFRFPGMDVIQFTFFDKGFKEKNNMITYTGTHDNDTIKGWFKSLRRKEKQEVRERLLEKGITEKDVSRAFMRYALTLKPKFVIFNLQDVLGLGSETRTNRPGIECDDNWVWKMADMTLLEKRMKIVKKIISE